jgi:hypothetical protein
MMAQQFSLTRGPAPQALATAVAVLICVSLSSPMGTSAAATEVDMPVIDGSGCAFSEPERRLAALLTGQQQRRPVLRCRSKLQQFAHQRAMDMARRGYLAHLTPDHEGPNQLLRASGYALPQIYRGGLSNNVESIVGGIESPEAVWRELTASISHRSHLLGAHPAYLEQDEFGLAYVRDLYAPHVNYWVVIIARQARVNEAQLICTPDPAECFRIAKSEASGP